VTLDELMKVYDKAASNGTNRRAGIRAVVEALRDEMRQECYNIEVDYFLKEILASDGVDKAAGGSTREDETGVVVPPVQTPAAAFSHRPGCPALVVYECTCSHHAPAAAPVCEWKGWATRFPMAECNPSATYVHRDYRDGDMCPLCGKQIKFKEDSE